LACAILFPTTAPVLIYLIRHGETDFNREGRLQGRLDSRLTEKGQEEARRMAEHLRPHIEAHPQWAMIVSPAGRTRATAGIVHEALGLACEMQIEPRLAEVDVGSWEGWTREDLEREAPGVFGQPGWLCRSPDGEAYEVLAGRLAHWLEEIDEDDGVRRIVVSHGIAGRVLRHLYAKEHPDKLWSLPAPPQDAVFRLHGGVVHRLDEG
jgi:broad specificity phosphatase PhoE